VINSNLCRNVVSRTVSEIRRLIGRKSPIRTHPALIQRPLSGWPPSNFGMNVISPETRMMGLPYGEEIMVVCRTMWTQSTSVTDRRTDGQTERVTITKTVQRIASHGKNGLPCTSLCKCYDGHCVKTFRENIRESDWGLDCPDFRQKERNDGVACNSLRFSLNL